MLVNTVPVAMEVATTSSRPAVELSELVSKATVSSLFPSQQPFLLLNLFPRVTFEYFLSRGQLSVAIHHVRPRRLNGESDGHQRYTIHLA